MKSVYIKILSVALVLSFVIPNTFFLYPKKVEAAGGAESCAAGYVIAGVSKIVATISAIYSVPDASKGNDASNYQQEASAYSGSFTECILRPLGQQILLVLVRNIGASVVEWVNSGFDGKPLFVTDFEGQLEISLKAQNLAGFVKIFLNRLVSLSHSNTANLLVRNSDAP